MGNERVTLQNLEVVEVRPAENLILVKGSIPGPSQGLVLIRKGVKASK
jgi:large subunit ribosomal protein L3